MNQSILRAEQLALGYERHVLFRDLSFAIASGEIVGIVGPNGCGKTTLLRALLGLLPVQAGRVERAPGLRISYVPQRGTVDRMLPVTVQEVVMMGLAARAPALHRPVKSDYDCANRALALFGMEPLRDRQFRALSSGQQQRVLLARALATEPDLLVLDEPTFGMDVAGEATTLDFLRDLNRRRQVTILIVTHQLAIVLNLAHSIMLMGADSVLQGPVKDVLREDRLSALYGVPVRLGRSAGNWTLVVDRGGGGDA
jgi:ABC-type Mn2+/Zn2+ transport system ATPase subunit